MTDKTNGGSTMTDHDTKPCPVCDAEDHGIDAHVNLTAAVLQAGREVDRARSQLLKAEQWAEIVVQLARRDVQIGIEREQALQGRLAEAEKKLSQRLPLSPDPPAPAGAPPAGAPSSPEGNAEVTP